MGSRSSGKIQLYDLPEDVLITLFEYCDIRSLCRLSRTCKKFNEIICSEDGIWRSNSINVVGSNMSSPLMRSRCKPILTYRQRCRFGNKWLQTYGSMHVISFYPKCMPWCNLQRDYLFCSIGRFLRQYSRKETGDVNVCSLREVIPCEDDVAKFSVTRNEVVCAGRDGMLRRLKKHNLLSIDSFAAHTTDILAVDANEDIIITGCKDSFVKIWKTHSDTTEYKKQVTVKNRVLSTAILPSNSSFVVGTPGTNSVHPLQYFDLESAMHIFNFGNYHAHGAGILDIIPERDDLFFTCGYDTKLQLWDIRSPESSVGVWTEPFDNTLYCVQTDHNVTMMTGSSQCGTVLLWDKRVQQLPVKAFYIPEVYNRMHCSACARTQKGPTYSVAFDGSHKYMCYEQTMFEFTFL